MKETESQEENVDIPTGEGKRVDQKRKIKQYKTRIRRDREKQIKDNDK